MTDTQELTTNRILIVDDEPLMIDEYVRCLGGDYEPSNAVATLTELESVLFGEKTDEYGAIRFHVETRNQGEAAVEAVRASVEDGLPFLIVFLDIRMPPGIDGIEAAKRIRELDPNINIVIVTGSSIPQPERLGVTVPPADKIFYFKKPFHAAECRQLAAALCGKWHADMALRRANEDLEHQVEVRTAALQKIAYYDSVTRLPNRLLLFDVLQKMIDKAEGSDGDTAVVLLDIERFSFINETMGHESGTELLRSIGNRLSRSLSEGRKGSRIVIGRFGADEFAVLIPGNENEEAIRELTEQVRTIVTEPFLINGRDLFLKASIGVAWHPVHGRKAKSIFRRAEAALHRSKQSLDGAVIYYHSAMRHRAKHRFEQEAEFRGAIERGQITAFYQPQQCLSSGKITGVEALARWIRHDGSVVPPSDFVPLSEEMGISDVLFETIMNSVCSELASWQSVGDWNIPVSVNLSAHQLRNRDLVSLIKGILQGKNVDQKLINIELTETALLEDLAIARPVLNDLSAYGVGLHIDDFGTGYSSLSYLAQLPVQTLKIDRSFISKLMDSATNARVVQAIIALSKSMGLGVVAEGVETDQQYAAVRQLGCDLAQGYFIAKPMPADEFHRWCKGHEDSQSRKRSSTIVAIDRARQ